MSRVLDILRCPNCLRELAEETATALRCRGCNRCYPVCAGIPWVYRDVESSRAQWSGKRQLLEASLGGRIEQLGAALQTEGLMVTTRRRLERLRAAAESQLREILELLEPFDLAENPTEGALPRDRIPSKQHFESYFDTIFRDWAWGAEETRQSLDLVTAELADESTGKHVLVLGGGAGRLTCDLAGASNWASVTQLDINPLLTRVGAMLSAGGQIQLTEIPRHPSGADAIAVPQALTGPAEPSGACFVLGDALSPPFGADTFDVLITPWFIDIVPEDFRLLARRLNRLLRRGGAWVSFGPLSFESQPPASAYTREEIEEALQEAGFETQHQRLERVPYLHSPHGSQCRNEDVFVFRAQKRESAEPVADFSFYPEWMRDPSVSVPRLALWQRMQHERVFDAEILGLIDGRSSIQDIVKRLARKYSLAPERCAHAVNRFFSAWFERSVDR